MGRPRETEKQHQPNTKFSILTTIRTRRYTFSCCSLVLHHGIQLGASLPYTHGDSTPSLIDQLLQIHEIPK